LGGITSEKLLNPVGKEKVMDKEGRKEVRTLLRLFVRKKLGDSLFPSLIE
jgi:hypothetical protein